MQQSKQTVAKSPPNEQVAPSNLVTSILISCPVFSLLGLREAIYAEVSTFSMLTVLMYILIGLVLCFFWRRMNTGVWKDLTVGSYLASLWLYLILQVLVSLIAPDSIHLINILALLTLTAIGFSAVFTWMHSEAKKLSVLGLGLAGLTMATALGLQVFRGNQLSSWQEGAAKSGLTISASDYETKATIRSESMAAQATEQSLATDKTNPFAKKSPSLKMAAQNSPDQEHIGNDYDTENLKEKAHAEGEQDLTNSELGIAEAPLQTTKKIRSVPWSYDGKTGPYQWAQLSPAFRLCERGQEQSPIDIPHYWRPNAKLQLNYQASPYSVIDLGHTIQVNLLRPQEVRIGKRAYQVEQMQFRTPSEHLLNGKAHPLEIQIFHRSTQGELAIIGIFAKLGEAHPDIENIWRNIPSTKGNLVKPREQQIQIGRLLPADQTSYRYAGSITTPPCKEGVNWHVLQEPIEISSSQLKVLRKKYQYNARPPQGLHFR